MNNKKIGKLFKRLILEDTAEFIKTMDYLGDKPSVFDDVDQWLEDTYGDVDSKVGNAVKKGITVGSGTARHISSANKSPTEYEWTSKKGNPILSPSMVKKQDDDQKSSDSDGEVSADDIDDLSDLVSDEEKQYTLSTGEIIKYIKRSYKGPLYAEVEKNFTEMEKYKNFVHKLLDKIVEFATRKERQDILETTQENLTIFQEWLSASNKISAETMPEPPKTSKNRKEIEAWIVAGSTALAGFAEQFKTLAEEIKSAPLKKWDRNTIMGGIPGLEAEVKDKLQSGDIEEEEEDLGISDDTNDKQTSEDIEDTKEPEDLSSEEKKTILGISDGVPFESDLQDLKTNYTKAVEFAAQADLIQEPKQTLSQALAAIDDYLESKGENKDSLDDISNLGTGFLDNEKRIRYKVAASLDSILELQAGKGSGEGGGSGSEPVDKVIKSLVDTFKNKRTAWTDEQIDVLNQAIKSSDKPIYHRGMNDGEIVGFAKDPKEDEPHMLLVQGSGKTIKKTKGSVEHDKIMAEAKIRAFVQEFLLEHYGR
tara:strand:+ start:991 stop:2601 length:1611 start_codon:yes stop_codon:yes gene_type:complete